MKYCVDGPNFGAWADPRRSLSSPPGRGRRMGRYLGVGSHPGVGRGRSRRSLGAAGRGSDDDGKYPFDVDGHPASPSPPVELCLETR